MTTMLRTIAAMFLVVAALTAGTACASESAIRQGFQAKFPNANVESVARTPFAGIYEVVFNGQIAYTDEKLSFVFFGGNLVDVRSGSEQRNFTRERSLQLTAQTLRKSTDQAIKRVRGNGKRVIYTFEDPNCTFCRQLQQELVKLDNITVYTFLFPILSQDSVDKSRAIWCAKDRAKAWDEVMLRGASAQSDGRCETPLEMNLKLAQRFGLRATPAIFFADGTMSNGYMPASELELALNSVASK
jgi:thiol:disulfide interchange protein DsbC